MSMTIEQRISVDIDNHFWRGYPMPDYLTDAEKDIVGDAACAAHELAEVNDDEDDCRAFESEEDYRDLLDSIQNGCVEQIIASATARNAARKEEEDD